MLDAIADFKPSKVFTNEEYLRVVVPDEQTFLKREDAVMMLGSEVPRWMGGKEIL